MKPIIAGAAFAVLALGAAATPACAGATLFANYGDWSAATARIHTAGIDAGPNVIRLGEGDVSITFDQVTFHQSAAISGQSPMFYIPAGYYGAATGAISSQQGALSNILITLPDATRAFSLGFGAWNYPHHPATATFLLSNGDSFTLGASGGFNYDVPDFFGVTDTTPFTSVLVTSNEVVMNVGRVAYGVPEPTTWAMMLLGFFGLGAALRRRRRALVAA